MTLTHPTLARQLAPTPSLVRDLLLVGGGAAFIALLAQAEVPLQPVPMTLQTLGVLLVGAALGWKRAFAAVLLYALAGAAGLPVYAGGASGFMNTAGTGLRASIGYVISWPFAAALVGFLVERFGLDRRLPVLGAITGLKGAALMTAGLTPFIIGDTLKLLLAALLLPTAWQFVRK